MNRNRYTLALSDRCYVKQLTFLLHNNCHYFTLNSLTLFWLAERVQWIFEISALDVDFPSPCYVKFHFRWSLKPRDQKQETGNDCDVISGLQVSGKRDVSAIFLFSYKQRTFVLFLGEFEQIQWLCSAAVCTGRFQENGSHFKITKGQSSLQTTTNHQQPFPRPKELDDSDGQKSRKVYRINCTQCNFVHYGQTEVH